jgi:hypothetical protein
MGGYRSSSTDDAGLRVSDAERNDVADKLSGHFADGRLDQAEFKERLDRAMSAKTRGDLSGLFSDLPRQRVESAPVPARRRRRLMPLLLVVLFFVIAANATFPFFWGFHFAWILWVVAGVFLWRTIRHHHRHSHDSHSQLEH